jgi:PKD repeat protein
MNKRNFAVFPLFLLMVLGGCNKNEPVPVAAFTYSGSNQFKVPCKVQFNNQSSQAYSFEWWFGKGSLPAGAGPADTTIKDPLIQYTKPGKYTVMLRAYTESRKEWASVKQVITIKDTVK